MQHLILCDPEKNEAAAGDERMIKRMNSVMNEWSQVPMLMNVYPC